MLKSIMIFLCIASVLLLSGCNGGPGVHAYYRGNKAYACGDYQTAFANYLYAANQDVVPAQYAVGYQYYYGQGTKRDEPKSILWFQRAAYHSVRAQYALHLIQENRPPQPWVYQLKEDGSQQHRTTRTKNACVINVHCEK